MYIDNRFASRADSVEELPEPFRRALLERLRPQEAVRHLVYGPSRTTLNTRSPATVLAVGDRRWLVVTEEEDGSATVDECDFADTLLLELSLMLLQGQLKIDFVTEGESRSTAVEFNTVMDKLYRQALELILNRIEEPAPAPGAGADAAAVVEGWPLKFRNLSLNYLSPGQHLRAGVHWPTMYGGFNRELAPAAALLLTEREILLIAEEKSSWWFRRRDQLKLGEILTYFPLVRLARFHIGRHDRLSILNLEAHGSHGGERLEILFPPEQEQAVSQFMERAAVAGL